MIIFAIALIIATLCAITVIYSNTNILIRSILVILLISSSLYGFIIVNSYKGKPVRLEVLPHQTIIYGQAIDFETSTIYLLYTLIDNKMPPQYVRLDYELTLHQALVEGLEGMEGRPFLLENSGQKSGDGKNGGESNGKEGGGDPSMSLESTPYRIYQLPSPILPKKDDQ